MPIEKTDENRGFVSAVIRFCLDNKLVVALFALMLIAWGILVAPFDWELSGLPRDPVPVDAIPDIGENQQIVFTGWHGRSPQDIEDQITYPLTVSLLGIPGVKTIRSYSFFGFSSIYVIFKEDVEFYWSRSRVLEKLSSLPSGTLPEGVKPALGPDATALGQVFWYTLEGRDKEGNPTGGWNLNELRSAQDWYVRYGLLSAEGVSEVASIGGFVEEYQIDVDPNEMRAFGVSLNEVFKAVKDANIDVGARTIEINKAEYVIRGLGFIENLEDLRFSVVRDRDNVPVYLKDVANIVRGPAMRRGALDKEGAEVVGGVVVVRYGENPLEVIKSVKEKIREISPGLPKKTLKDGRVSQLEIVPFYDRTGLIYETLGTLNKALKEEILITIIVIIAFILHLTSSLMISGLLPIAVLLCFIAMKLFGVDANVVALSGIAIAIGTMVDMGIVVTENVISHLNNRDETESKRDVVFRASSEVGSAVLTAVSTTIISFLPVFAMQGPEGKLFKPLAFTKTFALFASVLVALMVIPPLAEIFLGRKKKKKKAHLKGWAFYLNWCVAALVLILLSKSWMPLGPEKGVVLNTVFLGGLIGAVIGVLYLFQAKFTVMLRWTLDNKKKFMVAPLILLLFAGLSWQGFDRMFFFLPDALKSAPPFKIMQKVFPGLGEEFMPALDEGSFLYMPTTMPHASIGEALDVLQKQDKAIRNIPEVASVVGKIGRVDSPLDPAPISMVETIITYLPEYVLDKDGKRKRFQYDDAQGKYVRDAKGKLIEDAGGRPYRQWRESIKSPDDIWEEITKAGEVPGTTSAPKLQPIAARIVMLQSGMRAPMGVKVKGPDLKSIEKAGFQIEKFLKEVPSISAETVIADRVIGKPYLEIDIDRKRIARYGISIADVQNIIEIAIGGKKITTTVEGRERYPVRVRYMRELRDSVEALEKILVPARSGTQIPLGQLAEIQYVRGPQVIKSEDTFLTGYVIFDKREGYAEVDVVEEARKYLEGKIETGELDLPEGVNFAFAGSYENQVRSAKRLAVVLPLALFVIFMILYFQFRSVVTTFFVFSGIVVAWCGGFVLLWAYGQDWFMHISLFGVDFRDLFQIRSFNLSVAVWVGFLALFGIATDSGVIMATYLDQNCKDKKFSSKEELKQAVLDAGQRRVRPCIMTTATTILALLPVLSSTGRGADIMVPMAIPSFGGMVFVLLSLFIVPVLYFWRMEKRY